MTEIKIDIDKISTEANEIWKEFRDICAREKITYDNIKRIDELMLHYKTTHRIFYRNHPLVLRFMIELGKFSSSAFKKYLKWLIYNPFKSHEEFLGTMAKYARFLYQEQTPHYHVQDAQKYEMDIKESLLQDSNELKDQYEKAKKEVEKKEENNKQYQKEELLRILRQNLANKE
ncbi:MAG: hypothetical protein KAS12_01260 [Candidatus Aenigmarchaeota archaeon]|nr:hypothetical protein [Candidatus Aenigmarchaeota archaeon]